MATDPVRIKTDVAVDFGNDFVLTGELQYDPAHRDLVLYTDEGPEHISTQLTNYDLTAAEGCVFIKDWSEHSGLAGRLFRDGLVDPVHSVRVGPFAATAIEVRITF